MRAAGWTVYEIAELGAAFARAAGKLHLAHIHDDVTCGVDVKPTLKTPPRIKFNSYQVTRQLKLNCTCLATSQNPVHPKTKQLRMARR
jgi:hypothetical protein